MLGSVVFELFIYRPRAEKTPAAGAADLLQCHDAVSALLTELGTTAAELEREAVVGDGRDPAQRWAEHERDWRRRWNGANDLCRFDRAPEPALGPAFEWMTAVWEKLPALQLSYRDQMRRFAEHPGAELEEMRAALDRSRKLLEEELVNEKESGASPQPEGSTPQ